MSAFFRIVYEVILPIFLIMGTGYGLQKKVGFDPHTLVRLNFWVFTPAFLFQSILTTRLSGTQIAFIVLHFSLLFACMGVIAWLGARLVGAHERLQRAIVSAVLFYNSGNYGVPVARLAFGGAGEAVQAIAIMLQNTTNFTVGLWLAAGGRGRSRRDTLRDVLRLPMIYILVVAWTWRMTGWPMPTPIGTAVGFAAGGLVPVALLTLGAQMALLRVPRLSRSLLLALLLRLLVGPLLSLGFVVLLRALGAPLNGTLAQALVVSTSFPTAVNSALVAIEYGNEPEFAAAAVFYSTLLSAITVSLTIYVMRDLSLLHVISAHLK